MAPSSTPSKRSVTRSRRATLLGLSVYLLLGLAFAAPANAEHLSHSRSHARRSLEVSNSNARRGPAPQDAPVKQVRGSLLNIDTPAFDLVLGKSFFSRIESL
ncbi:hypothetical protein A7U60_g3760 [Sanghuangporus baumii]|uniref:Uncharacterized protein n=1 Tax=Sanghuangporus baumii TaxID=108892 RepID=A0A9Q5I0L6_SANBA|nr:hypothetical protein A7U60_g3760 [Sanghuangporus baumii]